MSKSNAGCPYTSNLRSFNYYSEELKNAFGEFPATKDMVHDESETTDAITDIIPCFLNDEQAETFRSLYIAASEEYFRRKEALSNQVKQK